MSDRQSRGGLGEQFKGALADALQSGDFTQLNDLVTDTVVNTLNEVGISFTKGADYTGKEDTDSFNSFSDEHEEDSSSPLERERRRQQKLQWDWQKQLQRIQKQQMRHRQEQMRRHSQDWQKEQLRKRNEQTIRQKESLMQGQKQLKNKLESLAKFKKIGNVSNVLYQVFGGIGLGITSFVTLMLLGATWLGDTLPPAGWIVNIAFLAFFGGMVRVGTSQGKRLKRARRYMQLCGDKMYAEVKHIADSCGKSSRYVIRDIQKMLRLGMFPEGHLDTQKTCFMLNDNIYRQYLETEENHRKLETENRTAESSGTCQTAASPKADDATREADGGQKSELDDMVSEGMECIRKLHELNDNIPGEVISAKLLRLETLLKEIFESVRQHPEQMHRMHKLMNYYLPTTLKLVETYEEFDKISTPGEEILAAKAEIENTLDTINQAFTELLNNLFQDAVFDATTDAQVLKTMLAREGLMNEMEFTTNNGGN